MGDGNSSSFRWQEDRHLSLAEQVTFWKTKYQFMRDARDQEVLTNIRLTKRIVELERLLAFTRADELR